jgi:exodeoxyribonuclease V alpha subunit
MGVRGEGGAIVKFDATQHAAIARATAAPFSIITGGAGTGKTTIIRAITETLEARGETVALAAFAGKAAARIREACAHPASTIHRLLGYNGKAFQAGPLSGVSVVIDEASMIDSALLAEIVRRAPRRLVLVGDQAQLPPVGRGQPFHDLIELRPDLVANLTTCYRATEAVFQAATAIRNGGRPPMDATSDGERWTMRNTGDAARTQAQILAWVEADAFDFSQDVILVARNGETPDEPCTVRGLNAAIVGIVSPRRDGQRFNVGDRIINTKNVPELDVWNGTTGTVHAVDHDGGVWVRTDIPVIDWGKTTDERKPVYTSHVLFARDMRLNLQLAYAMTVHKAQGSQYRNVCMACFTRDGWGLLDRALLYTGVTRTREACCVVGEMAAVWGAIDKTNRKRTVMQELSEGKAGG